MTHFANADLRDHQKNQAQLNLYRDARRMVLQRGHAPRYFHAANGAATLLKQTTENSISFVPVCLFTASRHFPNGTKEKFKPVMSLKTRALQIKDIKKGTAVSYGGSTKHRRISALPYCRLAMLTAYQDDYLKVVMHLHMVNERHLSVPFAWIWR